MKKIIVYAEITDEKLDKTAYELISKAYELNEKAKTLKDTDNDYSIEVVAIGRFLESASISDAYCAGATKVTFLKCLNINEFDQNTYCDVFVEYFRQNPSDIIIFPATTKGRMLAPKVTTLLNCGLVADCTGLDFILDKNNNIKLAATRPTFGAELMATILSKVSPECATIRPGTFKASFDKETKGEYIEKSVNSNGISYIKLLETHQDKSCDKIDFSKAKVVLAGGYGLKTEDNKYFKKLKLLAKNLNVNYAVTRKVVDFGIESNVYQIGQTGNSTTADIYIAFGVSGAIQHIMGMKNSKTIVAINSDENAEIFKYCDYKIVADAKMVIDELLKLKQ